MDIWGKVYINANKAACAFNAVISYLWREKSLAFSLEEQRIYLQEYQYCNPLEMERAIIEELRKATTKKGAEILLKGLRGRDVSFTRWGLDAYTLHATDGYISSVEEFAGVVSVLLNEYRGEIT